MSDPFATIPNAGNEEDAKLDAVFGPLTMPGPRGYDIIERTGQAEYYLREARRSGLPLPGYVTVSAHDHGGWSSSQVGIQLAGRSEVLAWAAHFGTLISDDGLRTSIDGEGHHEVMAYCGAEKREVPGLAEHTQAAEQAAADAIQPSGDVTGETDRVNLETALAEHTQAAVEAIESAARKDGKEAAIDVMIEALDTAPDLSDGIDPRTFREVYDAGLLDDSDIARAYGSRFPELSEHTQAACDTITRAAQ